MRRGCQEGEGGVGEECAAACVYAWRVEIERLREFEDVAQLCNLPLWHTAASWPRPLWPHHASTTPDDLPQHLCDTNFAQENKVIHSELLWAGGEWRFMSTLCTYWSSDRLSDKQTASQPGLAWHSWQSFQSWQAGDCAYYANMQGKLIRSAGATVSAKSKTKRGVCAISTKATANVCKYNAHTPRKQHT